MATVTNASDSEGEVATMTDPQTQTQQEPSHPFTFEPHPSALRPQAQQVLESVETAESRPISPLPRRHNTRSSRSVSPSLLNTLDTNDRTQDSKSKGKGRAKSTSASSTHQSVEATNARGGKRKVNSDNDDAIDGQISKRAKSKHNDPSDRPQPATRKRNLRGKPPGSPIVEADDEDEVAGDHKAIKRNRKVPKLPHEELEFSYVHVHKNYPPPQSADEQTQVPVPESSSSRTPQPTSNNTPASTQAPAQAESSQRSDAKPNDIAEQRAIHSTPTQSTSEQALIQHTDTQSKPNTIAEQRAVHGTLTLSTPQQPVIARTDTQSNGRSNAHDVDQHRSAQRYRSDSTPPLPTITNPHPVVRATFNFNNSPIARQGLPDTRVAQGSARVRKVPSDPVARETYLQKEYGKPRSRVLHPVTKTVITMGPVEVYEDSEHEEDIEDPFTPDDFKEWKSDLKVARKAYESVLSGERLPDPKPSSNGMEKRIVRVSTKSSRHHPLTISQTRRKLGETPPASRPRRELFSHNTLVFIGNRSSEETLILTNTADIEKLRAIAEWTQSSEDNFLPSKERLIGLLEASKYEDMTQVRSAAPSPASQQAPSQPPSTKSTSHSETPNPPRTPPNQPDAASRYTSAGIFAVSRSEMKQPAKDYESNSDALDDEPKDDTMSENASEVDANEAHPTTPIQIPSQRASEPRAWSSVLTTVKNVVSSPFKFFGRTPTAGGAVTTNGNETEFTFAHPNKLPHPLTTPTRTSKQRVKPQSERRDISTKQRRVSSSSRVPQTERHRRHVDRTPLHLRGAPSASDMQKLYDQQASTRQRQREAETASLEQDEPSHGKTFRAPSPLSDDSDSDDDDDEVNGDEIAGSVLRKDWAFLTKNKPVLQAPENEPAPTAAPVNWDKTDAQFEKACLKPKSSTTSRVHFEDERSKKERLQEREERIKELFIGPFEKNRLCNLNEHMNRKNRVVKMDGDDQTNPYYFARDPERHLPMYRMIKENEPDWICENDFGEEAWWFHLPPDSENQWESFWKLEHGQEPYTRGRASRRRIDFEAYMNKPENREKEKKLLLSKWNAMSESKKQALLPKLPQHLMNIMEFDDGLPHRRNKITKGGKDAFMDEYAIYQPLGFPSTSAATSSGTTNGSSTTTSISGGTFKAPSPSDSGSDNEEDGDVERPEDIQTVPAPGSATPTPPPKPRPGNAQLPQPLPANAALGSANKYRPFTPSNLRNVTQMSPLQQDQESREESSDKESDKENRQKEKVNGATETMTKEKAAAKLKDVYDLIRDLNAQGKIPPVVLPKARVMDFELPPEYPGKYSDYRDEINGAIKAAFNKENKENERN
jgi:hypothetical protein